MAGAEFVVIRGQILQVFHGPRGADFSKVQVSCKAPNKAIFFSSIIMLNDFNRGKRTGYIISIYKSNSYAFFLLSGYLGLPKMICKIGSQSLTADF